MSESFKQWKAKQGLSSQPSIPEDKLPPLPESKTRPGLTEEAVSRLDDNYLNMLAAQRARVSRAPSVISSVRSGASTTSMLDRLAKMEKALTTLTLVSTQQNEMLRKQDEIIRHLSARVIGEDTGHTDSVSHVSATSEG